MCGTTSPTKLMSPAAEIAAPAEQGRNGDEKKAEALRPQSKGIRRLVAQRRGIYVFAGRNRHTNMPAAAYGANHTERCPNRRR